MGAASVGARTIRPTSSRRRKDTRALKEIREEAPGKYVEDPGVLYAARLSESATARGKAELNRRLATAGRRLKPGGTRELREGEGIYLVRGSDIKQLTPKEAAAALERAPIKRYALGSRAATTGRAQELRSRAADITKELDQLAHRRSRLVGSHTTARGAAESPQRVYYVGERRFETREAAEAHRKAHGGNVRVLARTRGEAKRIGELAGLERLISARKKARADAIGQARKVEEELVGSKPSAAAGRLSR